MTGCLIHFGLNDWIPIEEVAAVLDNEFLRSATYMIIGAGALVFLIAICGCLGAILENRCLLVLVSTQPVSATLGQLGISVGSLPYSASKYLYKWIGIQNYNLWEPGSHKEVPFGLGQYTTSVCYLKSI